MFHPLGPASQRDIGCISSEPIRGVQRLNQCGYRACPGAANATRWASHLDLNSGLASCTIGRWFVDSRSPLLSRRSPRCKGVSHSVPFAQQAQPAVQGGVMWWVRAQNKFGAQHWVRNSAAQCPTSVGENIRHARLFAPLHACGRASDSDNLRFWEGQDPEP